MASSTTSPQADVRRSSSTRRGPVERPVVWAIAAAAALGAGAAGAQPTATPVVDPLLAGAFAAVLTFAGSRSRRWPVLVPVALAVVAARGWVLVLAMIAAAAAIVAARSRSRSRIWGAIVVAVTVQALLRLPDLGFHGATALLVAVGTLPLLVSGYRTARRRERRRLRRGALVVAGAAGVIGVGYAALVATCLGDLDDGASAARDGLRATRTGDTAAAARSFEVAGRAFDEADARLNGWWARPARLVPVLSQHARAVSSAAEQGRSLADVAGAAVEAADYEQLRSEAGRFDVDRIRSTERPLRETADAISTARDRIGSDESPWLVAPLADELDDLLAELEDAGAEADLALEAVEVAPELLGADGPRRYLVVFVTPVELRGSGGFIGSFAELEVTDGALRLARTGSSTELIAPDRDTVVLEGVDEYEERYGAFAAGSDFRDLTFSPHFPLDGDVIRQAYPQLGGRPVDGVISIDPIALAALLELTGPIEAPLFGQTLTADTAADFLLRDNYSLFPDPDAQNDALSELVELTFEELTTGDLPGPRALADVLGPATRAGRIRLWSPIDAEQQLFARLGATGAFPEPRPDRDFLAVASQNSGNNKLDLYQRREIDYQVSVADSGELRGTVRVTVHNDVPLGAGLPDYVVGNSQGDPPGTNRMLLTVYTPHLLDGATIDGEPASVGSQREAGYRAYTATLVVPPGGSVALEMSLDGALDVDDGYTLDLAPQPTVVPDRLSLRVGLEGRPPTTREPLVIEERERIRVTG